jgi:hypothetical protein
MPKNGGGGGEALASVEPGGGGSSKRQLGAGCNSLASLIFYYILTPQSIDNYKKF